MRNTFAGVLVAALVTAGAAHAQDALSAFTEEYNRGRNTGVMDRARPEYSPIGIQLGAFNLSPSLSTSIGYVDNIFASSTNTQSDEIAQITGAISGASNWSRNSVNFQGSVSRSEHLDISSQSTTDFTVGAGGRLDVGSTGSLSASYQHSDLTESRLDSEAAAFSPEPAKYRVDFFDISAVNQFNRLRLRLDLNINDYSYDDIAGFNNTIIPNSIRDNTSYIASVRGDFALTPDTAIFAAISYDNRSFKNTIAGSNYDQRDSSGEQFEIGANFDITNLVRGEVGVGYFTQDVVGFPSNTDGVSLSGKVEYFITPLTTITLTGSRGFVNSSVLSAPGDVSTGGGVRVDHEVRRNVLVYATLGASLQDYVGIDRQDTRTSAGFGATYLINRAAQLGLSYDHRSQRSDGAFHGYEYDINEIFLSLTLRR